MLDRIKSIIRSQLTQGVQPRDIALTCAIAFVVGTFPFFGTTTLFCFLFGVWFRLNQPLLQALNYALTPVHLLGIPIYLKIGEFILSAPSVSIHPLEMIDLFKSNWRIFFTQYGMAMLHAILAWIIVAPFLGVLIYFFVLPIASKLMSRNLSQD